MANPEIAAIRARLRPTPADVVWTDMRKMYDAMGNQYPTAADVALRVEDAGGVKAEWSSTPGADPGRAILYLHGGGYVIGSIASHRHLASELGRAAMTRTLALDYRLAPEAPFPAAVDDALTGYRFLLDNGFKPSAIAIAGDSAGGGLTVATLLAAKQAGLPQPACGFCISPFTDLAFEGGSMKSKADEDPMVSEPSARRMASDYLGGAHPHTPLASPIHADLSGLAPLLIHVGSAEALLDDSIRLAGLTGAAEVPVRLEIWPEMLHVWHFFHPVLADARKAIASAGTFIREHMN